MKKILKLNVLTVCVCLAQQSYALELIEEEDLSQVTGQDGIVITHEISKATAKQINWYDPTPQDTELQKKTKMGIGLHNFNMEAKPGQSIKSQLEFDVGATDKGAGIRIAASVSPFTATADLNLIKTTCTNTGCPQEVNSIRTAGSQSLNSLGSIGLSTRTPLSVLLQTSAGLFNEKELAYIDFQLQNATISHNLGANSLLLNDFNFNFAGYGYMYVAADEGLVLTTKYGTSDHYIDLGRVEDTTDVLAGRTDATNPGVNIDLRYNTPNNERKNLMRFGASGAVTNAKLRITGDQKDISTFDISTGVNGVYTRENKTATGYADIVGAGGLHLALAADFTRAEDVQKPVSMAATTLEIGHTGKGSYAIEFSKLRPLTTRDAAGKLHNKNAYIDFGDIYFNTVNAKSLDFIINDKLKRALIASSDTLAQVLTANTAGDNFALIAIRGFDFQSIAAKARFISDNSLAKLGGDGGSWGIGIPIYNLNANIALKGTTYDYKGSTGRQGIAYNIMAFTEGYGIDKKTGLPSTTSLLLIDGKNGVHGEPVNYYAGLRNIDALFKSDGVIGYVDDGIYIRADNLLIAASAEVALGQLPGSKYNCTNQAALCGSYVAHDNFAKRDDVLTNIAFKIDGSGELLIIPGIDPTNTSPDTNFLSFEGKFKFRPLSAAEASDDKNLGSYFRISNEDVSTTGDSQVSALLFSKVQGELGLNGKIRLSEDTVVMDNQVNFNPSKNIAEPFRANFAMENNTNINNPVQKIAQFALTGGTMRSTLGIKPR